MLDALQHALERNAALQVELSLERSLCLKFRQQGLELEAELATDRARLAEAMANAERYLYIRTESLIHWKRGKKRNRISWPTIYAAEPVDGGSYRDRFDAAIDAAMKGTV